MSVAGGSAAKTGRVVGRSSTPTRAWHSGLERSLGGCKPAQGQAGSGHTGGPHPAPSGVRVQQAARARPCHTGDPPGSSWTRKGWLGREADPTLETPPANGKDRVGRREKACPTKGGRVMQMEPASRDPTLAGLHRWLGRARVRGGLFPELGVRADAASANTCADRLQEGHLPWVPAAQSPENDISKRRSGQLADQLPEVNEQVTVKSPVTINSRQPGPALSYK